MGKPSGSDYIGVRRWKMDDTGIQARITIMTPMLICGVVEVPRSGATMKMITVHRASTSGVRMRLIAIGIGKH